jgi:anthranilate phosphoribosyltransferase
MRCSGPDIVSTGAGGTNSTTIPSAVAVALFAWLATKAVAKHGLRRSDNDGD